MPISIARTRRLRREGFLLLPPGYLGDDLLRRARQSLAEVAGLLDSVGPDRVSGQAPARQVRLCGLHVRLPGVERLCLSPELVGLAEQVLEGRVLVVEAKLDLGSTVGSWHRDSSRDWAYASEGLASVTLLIMLDAGGEPGAPVAFVPRSHQLSPPALRVVPAAAGSDTTTSAEGAHDPESLTDLVRRHGISTPTGPAGSILVYDPRILHIGVPNLSPLPRRALVITYDVASSGQVRRDEAAAAAHCPAWGEPDGRVTLPAPSSAGPSRTLAEAGLGR